VVEEASVLHIRYTGVPLNSSAPNTAALLISWLNSADGQKLLWELDGMDLHTYPESRQREEVAKVKAAGGKLAVNTPQRLASLRDFAKTQKELEQILQQGSQ
jgi:ABC-type Fe3+ transport system substrate-binding protein